MAANQAFQLEETRGWKMGLRNLMRKENGEWFKTRRWWIQLLIWLVLIDGFLLFILVGVPQAAKLSGQPLTDSEVFTTAVEALFGIASLGIGLGIIIVTQDEVIGEKTSGTAAWVLSKPASRAAFYLSKLFNNGLSILLLMMVIPFLIAFSLLWSKNPGLNVPGVLTAFVILIIHNFFYLSLSLMVGVFAEKRSMVLAITLAGLLGGQLMMNIFKELLYFTPFGLSQIMAGVANEGPLSIPGILWLPVGITFLLSLVFVLLSIWKIQKLEF
ncbi:MAG: ABC transporter permease subunit [Anaerolineaceae bacterium]|nr:ABC transporter permease subunit [Anaerolineaceae bacterium]